MQSHRYSFFGQKTAMILQSGDWAEPWLFLTFIKKRDTGPWEKLAEGKTVKLSLPEVVALRAVVAGERPEWKAFHKSNGMGTAISVRLEAAKEDRGNPAVLISAGDYLRPISYPETVILERILAHVFEEKIANATGSPKYDAGESVPDDTPSEETDADSRTSPPPKSHVTKGPEPDTNTILQDSLAKLHFPPLPARLPPNAINTEGTLRAIRWDGDAATLTLSHASGTEEEIPTGRVIGARFDGVKAYVVIQIAPPAPSYPKKARPPASSEANAPPDGATETMPTIIRATSIKAVTEKALKLTNARGVDFWIPKSAIDEATPAPATPQDAAWPFAVKPWFAQKADFQDWVKST